MSEYSALVSFPFDAHPCPAILRDMRQEIAFVMLQPQEMTPAKLINILDALRDMVCSEINETPIQSVVFCFRGEATQVVPLNGDLSIEGAQKIATCILANALLDSYFAEGAPDIGKQLSLSARLLVHIYLELAGNIN